MTVAHAFVSVVPDGADASVVRPSNWNAPHTVNLTAADVGADDAGAAAAAQAASQPLDSDLTAIAALSTTSFGRSHLTEADAAAGRTLLGLGTLSTQSGTFSGTSSGTNTGDQALGAAGPLVTVRQAAGVPSGAPTGTELPIAFDSTATTGGLYVWTGAAWVLAGPIPPVITPG